MLEFTQQIVNGLSLGAIYALIALGYTMVYGIIKLINFAHGDIMMVGAGELFLTDTFGDQHFCCHGGGYDCLCRIWRFD